MTACPAPNGHIRATGYDAAGRTQYRYQLGNTPAIAWESYTHPAVIARVEDQQEWRATIRLPRAIKWLSREERGFLDWLSESPSVVEFLKAIP